MPVSDRYRGETIHAQLGDNFFDPVTAAAFPSLHVRFRNQRHAARIGLDTLTEPEWQAHFGEFVPLPNSFKTPLALRYHGHQFGSYNPDLGDGRGFLFAQLRETSSHRLLDLGTKGSGQTPWSRSGDGRLTLKGGVREILATEMLEALGVETSKTLSLFETGESLTRMDEPSPTRASVLVRLSHSHIRIGTFQRLAYFEQKDDIQKLIEHTITHYFPHLHTHPDPALGLFSASVENCARLAAQYFSAGFVHGVLNTDNLTLLGESFDYGPWRFLPRFNPHFTAAYFDETGRYAFGRQPEAIVWALARFAETLLPFGPFDAFKSTLEQFFPRFKEHLTHRTLALLGLDRPTDHPQQGQGLVSGLYSAMREAQMPFAQTFFDLWGGADPARLAQSPIASLYATPSMHDIVTQLRACPPHPQFHHANQHPYFAQAQPTDLLIETVEALWTRLSDDEEWDALTEQVAAIRFKGEAYAPLLESGLESTP